MESFDWLGGQTQIRLKKVRNTKYIETVFFEILIIEMLIFYYILPYFVEKLKNLVSILQSLFFR